MFKAISILFLLFTLFFGGIAMAQPVTVLISQLRQGTIMSSSIDVPTDLAFERVRIKVIIPKVDFEDTRNSFSVRVQKSIDNWDTSEDGGGFTWAGGRYVGKDGIINPPPTWDFHIEEYMGNKIRVVIDIPVQMRISVTAEVY